MDAKEKIRKYLKHKGIKPYHFYRETGLSHGFLDSGSGINSDKVKIIIEKYPDLNLEWLILDKGPMIIDHFNKRNQESPFELNESRQEYQINSSDIFKYLREKDDKIENMCKLITRLQDQNESLKKEDHNVNSSIDT